MGYPPGGPGFPGPSEADPAGPPHPLTGAAGDGHALPAVPAQGEVSRRGWEVPGYTGLKTLGSGGFGDVVLARHQASSTLVAVKYLHQDLLADPEFARMFRAEARVLASLEDRNIVRLYEYVESPSGAAIVMELIDGVSVRQILARHGATTAEAALVVLQGSLLGLAAAHARGVVHRDYKPENVLVDGQGTSKLTDFGIAARAGDSPVPAGTLAYAPPEQFAGGPASPAGDVYAATATFYECLTGRPPFAGDSVERMLYQHLYEPVPMGAVPAPLQPLVTAGLAKNPAERPSDAAAFVTRLRNVAGGEYGPDWEDRGRSNLGGAALLLAALWPSGTAPAVHGSGAAQVHLSPSPQAHPASKPGSSHESRHLQHERHEEHLQHERHEQHLQHEEHVHHEGHLKYLKRLRHLRHPRVAIAAGAATAVAGAAIAAAVILTGPSAPTLTGAWVASSGATYTFTAAGPGTYIASEESNGTLCSDDVTVTGSNRHYTGSAVIYRQTIAPGESGCEAKIGLAAITIDIAANGASVHVTYGGANADNCRNCAPQNWTRQNT